MHMLWARLIPTTAPCTSKICATPGMIRRTTSTGSVTCGPHRMAAAKLKRRRHRATMTLPLHHRSATLLELSERRAAIRPSRRR